MIRITHATLACAEWTEGMGVTKELWEYADADTGIDMGMANATLVGLLRAVASNLDYMENLGGKPAADLWPDIRAGNGWHNEVTDEEPHRWCSAWSLPINGKVYCVDLWLAGPGCTGDVKPKSRSRASVPDLLRQASDAARWLREHAEYMNPQVRQGYDAICDGLESAINAATRKEA